MSVIWNINAGNKITLSYFPEPALAPIPNKNAISTLKYLSKTNNIKLIKIIIRLFIIISDLY